MTDLKIELCTTAYFEQILQDIEQFWGNDRTGPLHHPMFVHQFGDSAFVVRDAGVVIAYLFGFRAQTSPVGYIHLVAVRRGQRGKQLARRLYERFAEYARAHGCSSLEAITTPENTESIGFHRALGFQLIGDAVVGDTPVVADYAGPGAPRVVFRKALEAPPDMSRVMNYR